MNNKINEINERLKKIAEDHKAKLELAKHEAELQNEVKVKEESTNTIELELKLAEFKEKHEANLKHAMTEIQRLQEQVRVLTLQRVEEAADHTIE